MNRGAVLRRALGALLVGLALGAGAGAQGGAEGLSAGGQGADGQTAEGLSAEEMLALGNLEIVGGRPEVAMPIAEALIARDPRAFAARLLASYAARDLGQTARAEAEARAAYALATQDGQRHAAALAIAQAQSSAGARTRAQIWLRRAAELAPTPAAKAAAIRDYRYVRARNPLSFSADLSLAPSDNVNGGTRSGDWQLGPFVLPVPREMQALPGLEAVAAGSAALTLHETQDARDRIGLDLAARRVRLSEAARAAAPLARAGDYAFTALEGFYEARRMTGLGEIAGRATLGHNRYGGAALSNYGRLELEVTREAADGRALGAAFGLERQGRHDSPLRDATVLSGALRASAPVAWGGVQAGLEALRTRSASPGVDSREIAVSLATTLERPVLGGALTLRAKWRRQAFGASSFTGGARQDIGREIGAELFLPRHEHYGFAPVIGLRAATTGSNAALFETRATALTLGLRSSF